MAQHADTPRVALQVSRDVVVASIQIDLDDDVLARFQQDLLDRIHKTGARGVILDVAGLDILDAEEFAALRRIIVMASLMGSESVLVGLQPGIASALIESGADVDGLNAAGDMDAAFALLQPETESELEPEVGSPGETGLEEDEEAEGARSPETEPPPGAER
jgi:rsbT antagonist protein RsbS